MSRRDTFIIAGQPDYMLGGVWFKHGREITSGDAEVALDGAPGTSYPLASIGSGEGYLEMEYSPLAPYVRGAVGVVHNLQDIGAAIRVIVGGADVGQVAPTTTEDQVNTTSAVGTVDQDPYGAILTEAAPTDENLDWSIRVGGFTNTFALAPSSDSQSILVRVKFNGDYDAGPSSALDVTIRAYDGGGPTPLAEKNIVVRAVDGDVFVFALRVAPAAFTNTLMTALEVEVEMEGPNGAGIGPWWHWTVEAISWLRIKASAAYDSGWQLVDATSFDSDSWDLYPMAADAQQFTGLPYWGAPDASGVNRVQNISAAAASHTWILFYWDDSDTPDGGRPRIFARTGFSGTLTGWRPEIRLTAEGPAYGTPYGDFGNTFSTLPRDVVRLSLGAERWVTRNESPRRAGVTIPHQGVDVAVTRLLRVLRRAGQSRPFMLINFSDLRSWSELSIYGPLTWAATQTPRTKDQLDDSDVLRFSVRIDVEEAM